MIALLQRVNWARVRIAGQVHGEIGAGLLVLVGLEKDDTLDKGRRLIDRVLAYRVFNDSEQRMNLSLKDTGGGLLLVSQFTLAADTGKGLRPGFSTAMPPDQAEPLWDQLLDYAGQQHGIVASGEFGANMQVGLENDGPVTFRLQV